MTESQALYALSPEAPAPAKVMELALAGEPVADARLWDALMAVEGGLPATVLVG